MKKTWTARKVIGKSFVEMAEIAPDIKNLQALVGELEGIAERAGMMARYLDEREGHGCGDQGHEAARRAMNKAGRIIHMKAFGYNAYHDLSF